MIERLGATLLALLALSSPLGAAAPKRVAPLCRAGFSTSSINDAGEVRCQPCRLGAATTVDVEGWTACVGGTHDHDLCPPGSGIVGVPRFIRSYFCVPCPEGSESVVFTEENGWRGSVCVRRRCPEGTVPVRRPLPVTDYECVEPLEGAEAAKNAMPPGRRGRADAAPRCPPGNGLELDPTSKTYRCSPCPSGQRVLTRLGWPMCGFGPESRQSRTIRKCGDTKVELRSGRCASCPQGSRLSMETGGPQCLPDF